MTPRELLLPESESRSVIQIRNCHKGTPPTALLQEVVRVGIKWEGGRTRLGNAVGGTRAREHRASEEIQHEMRLMHRTYWSHRRLLTWSRHWKMAASLKEKTRRPVFAKERVMTGTETRPVSMRAAACTHRRLHPPINVTNAAALTTSGSTARQAALEGSGVLVGLPPPLPC